MVFKVGNPLVLSNGLRRQRSRADLGAGFLGHLLDACPAHKELQDGRRIDTCHQGADSPVVRFHLLGDEFRQRLAKRDLSSDDRAGRRADDEVGARDVDAFVGEPGEKTDLPGNAESATAAEYECISSHSASFVSQRLAQGRGLISRRWARIARQMKANGSMADVSICEVRNKTQKST